MENVKVETPIGTIEVAQSGDKSYPGVWVTVNGEALVLVEFDPSVNKHVIRVWDHKDPDNDYEYKQTVE